MILKENPVRIHQSSVKNTTSFRWQLTGLACYEWGYLQKPTLLTKSKEMIPKLMSNVPETFTTLTDQSDRAWSVPKVSYPCRGSSSLRSLATHLAKTAGLF